MTRQHSTVRQFWGRAALGLAVACSAMALLAPTALADPQSDAAGAIDGAWSASGGDASVLGARDGDIYAAGAGFGQNFAGGAIFFTPETGARTMYGEILNKYRTLGGPAESDLGFPTIDEGPGRVSPESRNSIFSAPDQPVIFWTPDSGAWVVRGAINAAWDAVGGSAGTLGVPTADQTTEGDVVTQTFSGGKISFDNVTRQFTTEPADLAGQLGNVTIPGEAPAPPPPPAPPTETAPSGAAEPTAVAPPSPSAPDTDGSGGFRWHNWWLWWIIPLAALLLGSLVAGLAGRRRRSAAASAPTPGPTSTDHGSFDGPDGRSHWLPPTRDRDDQADHWFGEAPPSQRPDSRYDDPRADSVDTEQPAAVRDVTSAAPEFELFTHRGAHAAADDPDAVDTAPTPVQPDWETELQTGRHAALDLDDSTTFAAGGGRDVSDEYAGYDYEGGEYEGYLERPASEAEVMEPDVYHPDEVGYQTPLTADESDESDEFELVDVDEPVVLPVGDDERAEPDQYAAPSEEPPALHLPLGDPHLAPQGYPVKGRMSTGTYHVPGSEGYDSVAAEIWFADAAHAEANGFVRGG